VYQFGQLASIHFIRTSLTKLPSRPVLRVTQIVNRSRQGANMSLAGREHRRRIRIVLLALSIAATAAFGLAPSTALAKPGDLDRGFGRGGKVTRAVNFESQRWDSVRARVAELPGGRAVVLAERTLYAFAANGSTVRNFGGGAVKVADPQGHDLDLSDVAVDSRGRVLAVGSARAPGTGNTPEYAFVARYTLDGRPDSSFGENGFVVTDFSLPGPRVQPAETTPAAQVRAVGLAIDASDRVVLTGARLSAIGPCRGSVDLSYHEAFVARLDSSGARDPSFGENGVVRLGGVFGVDPAIQNVNPPVVDPDGKIYVSTRPVGPCEEGRSASVGRLDASGHPDPSFGEAGWVRISHGTTGENGDSSFIPFLSVLDPAGRLLLLDQHYVYPQESPGQPPTSGHRVAVVKRLLPTGVVDRDFGRRGVAAMSGPAGKFSIAAGAVDGGGRVLLAGTFGRSFFLGRLTAKGRIDQGFGTAGRVTTGFERRSRAKGSSLAIDARGKAIVAGPVASPRHSQERGLALARYLIR
jgi:uncharacterized delta-60 repeat protein